MKKIYLLPLFMIVANGLMAQSLAVNTDGSIANTSSILDVKSTNKGMLIPRVALLGTQSTSPIGGTLPTSLLIYNTAATSGADAVNPGYYYWSGSQWLRLFSDKDSWSITGNAGTSPLNNFIGTKDAQNLRILTNSLPSLYINQLNNFIGIGEEDPGDNFVIKLNSRGYTPYPYNYSGIQIKPTSSPPGSNNNVGFHIGLETTFQRDARLMNFISGGDLSMGIEGYESVRIKNSTRYIGINEPNPTDNLVIRLNAAAINPSPNNNYSGIVISNSSLIGTGNNRGFHIGLEEGFNGSSAHIMNQEGTDLVLGTQAIEMMRFKAYSHMVGINTSTPTHSLSVSTGANPNNVTYDGIQLLSNFNNNGNPNTGLIIGTNVQGNWQDKGIWNYDDGAVNFGTNNQQRMMISSTGSVGIASIPGFLSPYKLEVGGDVYVAGNANLASLQILPGSFSGAVLTSNGFGQAGWTDPIIYTQWLVNGINIYNKNTGNVGIGTSNPFAKFQVEDGSVLFYSSGSASPNPFLMPPVDGPGTRMMWFRERAAFRAGFVDGYKWTRDSIGYYSLATGYNVKASGDYSVALGFNNNATGASSFSIGSQTTASGNYSFAAGNNANALGESSVSMGELTIASGFHALALGYFATASGDFSTAIGNGVASDIYATTIGELNIASRRNSTAIGFNARALGLASTSIGYLVTANSWADYGLAMGYQTISDGRWTTALGAYTTATGEYSTATGNMTNTIGFNSFTAGIGTTAKANASFTIGTYNDISDNPPPGVGQAQDDRIFQIGIGTGPPFTAFPVRKNALTVLRNGNVGIGTLLPNAPLQFSNDYVDKKIALLDFTNSLYGFYGFGVNAGVLRYQVDHVLSSHVFYAFNSELMRIQGNGNVGIGISNPGFPLNFSSSTGDKISLWGNSGDHFGFGIQNSLLQVHSNAAGSDIAFGYGSSISFTEQMRIKGNGNVGIGTSTPGFPLNFANSLGDKISLYGSSGNHYGFGIQGSLLQMYSDAAASDIAFGYGNSGGFSENMRVKGNGNVGIGTITPSNKMEVVGAGGSVTLTIGNRFGFGPAAMEFVSDYGAINQWRPGYIRSNDLGGYTGALEFYTNGSGVFYGNVKGLEVRNGETYTASGTVSSWSDSRLKKNIQPFTDGLDIIKQINPVSFNYNQLSPFQTERIQIGILAQELEKLAPYMVDKNATKDFNDLRSVNNQAYIYLLINAVKEQQKQIEELKAKLNLLLDK